MMVVIAMLVSVANAGASDLHSAVEKALQGASRTDAEKARDANRMPYQTLKFFELRDDMRALELIPGGGWYTKVLAPILAERGQLYEAINTGRTTERVLGGAGFEKVKVLGLKVEPHRDGLSRRSSMDPFDFGVTDLDRVFTFRNYHNFSVAGRMEINKAVFRALKPGGIYGVVDHTRRHMEPDNDENGRRVDPVEAIKEIESAGFEFVDYSGHLMRPKDTLIYEVGHEGVTGHTDRFTLKFRKPVK